jgi:hypothetical protein
VRLTRTPFSWKKPCRSAAHSGRLKPPGKTMTPRLVRRWS